MGRTKHKKQHKSKVKESFLLSGYLLAIAVCFVIPLIHIKTILDPVLYPRLTALGILVFILAGLLFFEIGKKRIDIRILTNRFFIAFVAFILISIASLFYAINPIEGLTDIFKWLLVFFFTLLTALLINNSNKTIFLILKGVVINAIIFSIIGVVQYLNDAIINTDPNALYEVKGLMAHKNQYSISLFVLLPFLSIGIIRLEKQWMKMSVLATFLVLAIILLLQTRAVWLAFFISGIITSAILFFVNKKKGFIQLKKNQKRMLQAFFMLILLGVVLTIFYPIGPLKSIHNRLNTVFNPKYTSNEWRIEMWNATYQLMKEKSKAGVGAGNWKIAVYPYYGEYLPSVYRHWRNPHNDYLLIVSEKGLLGLLVFISMFLFLIFYGVRNMIRSSSYKTLLTNSFLVFGLLGYMVISFFSFPNERINHLIFLSLMSALIVSESLKIRDVSKESGIRKVWVILPMVIISYMAVHFGIMAINSELNVLKTQAAQEKQDWIAMEKFAEKAYSSLAPMEPKFSYPVSMYIGIAKYHKGDFEKALYYFNKSYNQHPTSISVMNNIGAVYSQTGKLDSAIVYYHKSLAIFPHYEYGWVNLAKNYYLQKKYQKAYQMILHCNPQSKKEEVSQMRQEIERKLDQFY